MVGVMLAKRIEAVGYVGKPVLVVEEDAGGRPAASDVRNGV
jgi:hypothetical protein